MFRNNLKKVACLSLAAVMTFSGVQAIPMSNSYAASVPVEVPGTKFSSFADAVEAMYNGDLDFVTGEYEVATFDDDYDYSVAKENRLKELSYREAQKQYICEQSMLWDKPGRVAKSITIMENCTNQPLSVITKSGKTQSYNWDYTIVSVTYGDYGSNTNDTTVNKIVNVKPSTKVTGEVSLPAYIGTRNYGVLECIELGDGAFLKSDITKVEIPSTYQRLCAYAFTGCTKLTDIEFTKATSSGNSYVIDKTASSESVLNSESNLHLMGSGLFAGCTSLKTPILPEKLVEGYMVRSSHGDGVKFAGATRASAQYSWVYIVSSEEGEILNSSTWAITTHVGNNKKAGSTYAKTSIQVNPVNKSGNADKNGTYFMGDGIYRDCYGITKVNISGTNPYIPTNTFAGCCNVNELKIDDSVEQLYLGVSSFAGYGSNSGTKSSIKELDFDTPNLKNLYLGSYAFKNCNELKDVNITATLNGGDSSNPYRVYYQGLTDHSEYVFENAFTSGSKFRYVPKAGSSNFTFEQGYFKNCVNLSDIILDNGSKAEGKTYLTIDSEALYNIGIKDFHIGKGWDYTKVKTGAFMGLYNTDTLTFESDCTQLIGEPFSNSRSKARTVGANNLKNVVFDSRIVSFNPETLCPWEDKTKYTSSATFYGLDNAILTFGENCEKLTGDSRPVKVVSEVQNYKEANVVGRQQEWSHSSMGEVEKVFIKNCNIELEGNCNVFRPAYVLSDDTKTGVGYKTINTTIYADGASHGVLTAMKQRVDKEIENSGDHNDNNQLLIKEYTASLEPATAEWVETRSEFDPSIVNGGQGMKIIHADGSYEYVQYSDGSGTSGYTLTGMPSADQLKAGNSFSITANYHDKVASLNVTVVPQKAVEMTVISNGAVVAGTEPKASDIIISGIKYNDGTESEVAEGNISVKLANGIRYTAGNNVVEVTYKGLTKQVVISAAAEKVVSMGAIQLKDKLYPGDTIDKSEISVTAYYNSGRTETGYLDYTIVNGTLSDSNDTIIIRSSNGVESTVKLNVSGLEVKAISVSYNGRPVQAGGVVSKSNFTVTVVYSNGSTRKLNDDEYDLVYAPIIGNTQNSVKVVYKTDESVCETVYITGVEDESPIPGGSGETESGGLSVPAITKAPEPTYHPIATKVPGSTGNPVETKVPGSTGNPSNTGAPKSTATPTVAPTATLQVINISQNPSAAISGGAVSGDAIGNDMLGMEVVKSITLGVGEKFVIKMANKTGAVFTSVGSEYAKVSNTGVITGVKVGKTVVTATDGSGNKTIYNVTVKKAPKAVKVSPKKKTLKKGKSVKIKVTFAKGCYSYSRKFSSSNKKVATVSSKGVVKAKKKGTCKITVKTFNGKKAVIKITVK